MRSGFWTGRYTYSALTKQLKLLTNNAFAFVLKLYLPALIDVSARLKHTALNYGKACACMQLILNSLIRFYGYF